MEKDAGIIDIGNEIQSSTKVHLNVGSDIIVINQHKLKLKLYERESLLSGSSWISVLALSASLFISMLTADFRDIFGIDKKLILGIFVSGFIGSVIWFIKSLRTHLKKIPIEKFIEELKEDAGGV